jgi:hypothetical protein
VVLDPCDNLVVSINSIDKICAIAAGERSEDYQASQMLGRYFLSLMKLDEKENEEKGKRKQGNHHERTVGEIRAYAEAALSRNRAQHRLVTP